MSDRKILVTGAGGFIGGRVVEMLHMLGVGDVRAAVRRWSSGARVGRLPVEIVRCDLRNAAEVKQALEGVTHIVHCAVSMEAAATIEGTRVLLEQAEHAGVKRIVYLSTIDVYGTPEGDVDETHGIAMTGKPYGDMKVEAERRVHEAAARGVPVTILRPTLVHGPFSAGWTMSFAQRLQSPPWLVAESDAQGTCNLVYVDDLVSAIISALDTDVRPGEAFNINGPERPTWNEYFHALNDAIGLPPLVTPARAKSRLSAMAVHPVRRSAKLVLNSFQPQITALYGRSEMARTLMKRAELLIRTTPSPGEFTVYSRRTSYVTRKAENILGYQPRFSLARALPLAAAWLHHSGLITVPTAVSKGERN